MAEKIAPDNIRCLNISVGQESPDFYDCVTVKSLRIFIKQKHRSPFQPTIFNEIQFFKDRGQIRFPDDSRDSVKRPNQAWIRRINRIDLRGDFGYFYEP